MSNFVRQYLQDTMIVTERVINDDTLLENITALADKIASCIMNGGKLVLCGNGGSASDALHFAGEIVGRFQEERDPWPAMVLNADVVTMTAISNDYGYHEVFSRQAAGHLTDKDIFIGISTSGNSLNIYNAVQVAKRIGSSTAGLLGKDGGLISRCVDYPIIVPSDVTARIQEIHTIMIHIICTIVEEKLISRSEK